MNSNDPDDLVKTLRRQAGIHAADMGRNRMLDDAANEIERLRTVIESVALHGDLGVARGAINWKR